MTAMRGALVVAVSFLIACGGGGKPVGGGDTISHVSQTFSSVDSNDGPTQYFYELEFTMPKDFPIDSANPFVTMTDSSGRHFQAKQMSISTSGDGVMMVQSVSAKFELADASTKAVVHIGDDYDIDISSGRVTRRAAAPAAP